MLVKGVPALWVDTEIYEELLTQPEQNIAQQNHIVWSNPRGYG